jgi:hypothetical protein
MLLIVWSLLLGLSQVVGSAGDSLARFALTSTWISINLVGLLSSLLLMLGLIGVLTGVSPALGTLGFVGIAFSVAGAALFAAPQFEQTFVWPLLARRAEALLEIDGPMFTDPDFFASYVVMGVLFAAGFGILAAQSLRRRFFPVVSRVFLLLGGSGFCRGNPRTYLHQDRRGGLAGGSPWCG